MLNLAMYSASIYLALNLNAVILTSIYKTTLLEKVKIIIE